ncbi:MAG: efflux RND transporter periplasmic adaptor subunit [Ruminococcus sp.]|nr:efflux RND transporter periplasmic adaptor subunit [Ruminococcus sp.]
MSNDIKENNPQNETVNSLETEETKAVEEAQDLSKAQEEPAAEETKAEEKPAETKIDEASKAIPKEKKSKKKLIIIIAAAAAVVIAVVLILIFTLGTGNADQDDSDDSITEISTNLNNLYGGIVEPQQTADINKDAERTVDQVYVKVGDTVKAGDKLFSYSTGEIESKIATAQIDLESIQNSITENTNKISLYQRQRSEATTEAEKLEYTQNIEDEETSKSQNQLQLRLKQNEIDTLKTSLNNSTVKAPIDGIVKQISNGSDSANAYMTILMNGAFRVKGTVDETNVRMLSQGMQVIVHSRNVEGKTWTGVISKIDTQTTADNQNNGYSDQNSDSASKYNFYITLDSTEDMLLGEHVYIEPLLEDSADADIDEEYEENTDITAETAADDAQ